MGREWYFNWGSKSSTKKSKGVKDGGGGGGGDGRREKKTVPQMAAAAAASGGCMNAVFHMFNMHHLHLCLHPQNTSSFLTNDHTPSKGVEAPRNSLETMDYSLNIPMDIQIKTNRRDKGLKLVHEKRGKEENTIPENGTSESSEARTPTLVARLMGLDVLPESTYNTPRSSSSSFSHISTPPSKSTKTPKKSSSRNNKPAHKSLPESPRSSSSSSQRRKTMPVVEKHRLSLQINKENNIVKEMESSRPSCSAIREGRKCEDENKTPGYYAKQIMKQVKETVSRRVGSDITNTIGEREVRRDENLLTPIKPKTSRLVKSSENGRTSKKNSERVVEILKYDVQEIVPVMDKMEVKPLRSEKQLKQEKQHRMEKLDAQIKKIGVNGSNKPCSQKTPPKSYESIKNKKDDEQFVRPTRLNNSVIEKKCKKTPFSSDLVHGSVPSIVPLKKDSSSLQAPGKLLKEQGSSKAHTTKLTEVPQTKLQEEVTLKPVNHEKKYCNTTTSTSTSTSLAEFQYISRILKCTGIDKDTPISFTKWFSSSHPLDPTIYHKLEAAYYFTPTNTDLYLPFDFDLSHSINRKLIFHLVDEILAEILKPGLEYCRHQQQHHINGLQLVKTLCTRIRSFPSANCKTLQDIDALVEKDMPRLGIVGNSVSFEKEAEAIVSEIEHDILKSLIQEVFGCGYLGWS